MDFSTNEPLEAGEDGVFDLGDPSVTATKGPKSSSEARAERTDPKAGEVGAIGMNDIEDSKDESPMNSPEGRQSHGDDRSAPAVVVPTETEGSDGVHEEQFGDAAEDIRLRSSHERMAGVTHSEEHAAAVEGTRGIPVDESPPRSDGPDAPSKDASTEEQAMGGTVNDLADGLANVRLPISSGRDHGEDESKIGNGDSDDEAEFHDALDSVGGTIKDALKAQQMKEMGNGHYKKGDFEEAIDCYSMALEHCPEDEAHKHDRAVYLGNRAACHLQLSDFDVVHEDCTAALELSPRYVKVLMRRAQANEKLEKYDLALEDVKMVLEIEPGNKLAKESAPRLEKLQKEKMEAMKDEALGKLKELGNSVLGHFGLSVDNFKMKQDPETGSYSINFER